MVSTVTSAPIPSYEKPSMWQKLDNKLAAKMGLRYLALAPYGPTLTKVNTQGVKECESLRGDKYVRVPCKKA